MPRDFEAKYVTVKQAADWLEVTPQTIRNWIKGGLFPAYQLNPSGRVLIKLRDIERAIKKKRIAS